MSYGVWGIEDIAPQIIKIGTKWRKIIKLWPLYLQSAKGGWVGPTPRLDALEKKAFSLVGD
jgi:hypothetical protein